MGRNRYHSIQHFFHNVVVLEVALLLQRFLKRCVPCYIIFRRHIASFVVTIWIALNVF